MPLRKVLLFIYMLFVHSVIAAEVRAADYQTFSNEFFTPGNKWIYEVSFSKIDEISTSGINSAVIPVDYGFDFSSGRVVALGKGDVDFPKYGSGVYVESYSNTGVSSVYLAMQNYLQTQSFLPPSSDWRWEGTAYDENWDYRGGGARWFKTKEGRYVITSIIDGNLNNLSLQWLYPYGNYTQSEIVTVIGSIVFEAKNKTSLMGYPCTVFQVLTDVHNYGSMIEKFYWHKASDYIQEIQTEHIGDDVLTFTNNNPLEIFPLSIESSAEDVKVGDGDYLESDNPSSYHVENRISYIKNETIEVPAGHFSCINFELVSHYEQGDGGWGTNTNTFWNSSEIGIIKVETRELEYDPDENRIAETIYTWELKSIILNKKKFIPAIPALLLDK